MKGAVASQHSAQAEHVVREVMGKMRVRIALLIVLLTMIIVGLTALNAYQISAASQDRSVVTTTNLIRLVERQVYDTLSKIDVALQTTQANKGIGIDYGSRTTSPQLVSAIAGSPDGGSYIAVTALDGIERVNAYMKVATYPMKPLAQAFFRPGRAHILPPCAGNKALASIDPDPDHCQINQQPEI